MPQDRGEPPAPRGCFSDEPGLCSAGEALLPWARQFIEEVAAGEHADRHSLEDVPFERHVALARVVPEALRDRRAAVRRAAAWVAGATDVLDEETVPLLVRLLRDRAPLTRMAGAWACGEIGEDAAAAVPALAAALGDRSGGVRFAAACALRGIGPPAAPAVPALLDVVRTLPAGNLRKAAVRALADIAPDAPAVREVVLQALAHPDRGQQLAGAYGVARATDAPAAALPQLRSNLASADPYLVTVTAWAVGKLADARGPSVAPALLDALKRMHWIRIEYSEEPGDECVSIRPVLGSTLERHLPETDDPRYEDFRLTFFLHVFHPAPAADTRWIDEIVTHPWYLKLQRRRFGHPAGAAEREAVREMVRDAQAAFAERMMRNPTLGVTPDAYASLPGFIKNHCRNIAWRLRQRRRKERARRTEQDVTGTADPTAPTGSSPDGGIEVLEVIEVYLQPEEREVARLVWLLGHTIPEAAALLSLTASQVKTRLEKAKQRLAARIA